MNFEHSTEKSTYKVKTNKQTNKETLLNQSTLEVLCLKTILLPYKTELISITFSLTHSFTNSLMTY